MICRMQKFTRPMAFNFFLFCSIRHDYQIFQKITKVEYDFPQGFTDVTRDLVQSLIVADPAARLGVAETGGFEQLKSHVFYQDVRWRHLHEQRPPDLLPYLPAKDKHSEHLWSSKQSLVSISRLWVKNEVEIRAVRRRPGRLQIF